MNYLANYETSISSNLYSFMNSSTNKNIVNFNTLSSYINITNNNLNNYITSNNNNITSINNGMIISCYISIITILHYHLQ